MLALVCAGTVLLYTKRADWKQQVSSANEQKGICRGGGKKKMEGTKERSRLE